MNTPKENAKIVNRVIMGLSVYISVLYYLNYEPLSNIKEGLSIFILLKILILLSIINSYIINKIKDI